MQFLGCALPHQTFLTHLPVASFKVNQTPIYRITSHRITSYHITPATMVKIEDVADEDLNKPQAGPHDDDEEWDTDDGR
jgi:hypothetical protein